MSSCRSPRTSVPRRLYKFTPYTGKYIAFVQSLLGSRRLKYSRPSTFNDPFEARPHIRLPEVTADEQRALLKQLYAGMRALSDETPDALPEVTHFIETAAIDEVRSRFEDVIQQVLGDSVLAACLAGTRRSILMWTHYADDHCGACVHLSGRIQPLQTAWPVTYCDEYPALTVPSWLKMNSMDFTRTCVLMKASQWSYEREYRLIGAQPEQESDVMFDGEVGTLPAGSVTGLTIGARMEEPAAEELARYAIDRGLPVWRAHRHDREYRLRFQRLK